MPGFDGTGPNGIGPMTGGGRGFCAVPYGRGGRRSFAGMGFGRGRGRRNWYRATGLPGWARAQRGWPAFGAGPYTYNDQMPAREEMEMLKGEAEALKAELKDIQGHIDALEKAEGSKGGE